MGNFYFFLGSFLFITDVISLWPAARFYLGELHFYFFFIFAPVLLIAMAMIFIGIMLKKITVKKGSLQKASENPSPISD